MISEIISTFLWSISPAGEARVGIPYGIINDIAPWLAFLIGWIANLMVFPLFYWIIQMANRYFWKHHFYKKGALKLARRAKKGTQKNIKRYGIWGLMVFVMIPLPVTGAYMGTLAAYIFDLKYKKSFAAVSLGVTISSVIVTVITALGKAGVSA